VEAEGQSDRSDRPGREARGFDRAAAWIAYGICVGYWAAIGAGYALRLRSSTAFPLLDELGWRIGYASVATVGAIIVSRRPRNVLGWVLCAIGASSAVAGFAGVSSTTSTVASTGAATKRPRRSRRSAGGSATRSTSIL
jgi:hypothetical protein